MSIEQTDTSPTYENKQIPDGEHTFKVVRVKSIIKGTTKLYVWTLEYPAESIAEGGIRQDTEQGEQVLLPSMMGDLLRVLGCKETSKNKFLWDSEEVVGDTFVATVSHEPDKKDPTKIRQQMTNFKDDENIPF